MLQLPVTILAYLTTMITCMFTYAVISIQRVLTWGLNSQPPSSQEKNILFIIVIYSD